jgi:hypothetical protein
MQNGITYYSSSEGTAVTNPLLKGTQAYQCYVQMNAIRQMYLLRCDNASDHLRVSADAIV